ncbi:hypothetical protein O5O45_19475 [Hahella aquimaris]|uniref:hypothetical protein n=1 Tax=Hahella sp. HNIBRBA332 TaxID=3015983 RepID=UPI00273B7959|nr:hypothetical protein [Hahella sp. HNIBRBA332]WLQ11912.1 hypothetical protein O5O45_19475 [Hahella sp. HNIBRBA332]
MDLDLVTNIMNLKEYFQYPKYRVVTDLALMIMAASCNSNEEFQEKSKIVASLLEQRENSSDDPYKHIFEINKTLWLLPSNTFGLMLGHSDFSLESLTSCVVDGMEEWKGAFFEANPEELRQLSIFYQNLRSLAENIFGEKGMSDPSFENIRTALFEVLLEEPVKLK